MAGLSVPAGKPDPTRYPRVGSGRVRRFRLPTVPCYRDTWCNVQLTADQLRHYRLYNGVFRRAVGRGSPYSSVCSTHSSMSDLSAGSGSLTTDFDASESTLTAADSDVEDGLVLAPSSRSLMVSVHHTLSIY